MNMKEAIKKCFQTAQEHGWWKRYNDLEARHPELFKEFLPDIIGGKLMLMVTELAEALEEIRDGRSPREIYYVVKTHGGTRMEVTPEKAEQQEAKPEGLPIELADVVIRIFDFAGWFDIDLARAIEIKMKYNDTRSHRHGGKTL